MWAGVLVSGCGLVWFRGVVLCLFFRVGRAAGLRCRDSFDWRDLVSFRIRSGGERGGEHPFEAPLFCFLASRLLFGLCSVGTFSGCAGSDAL